MFLTAATVQYIHVWKKMKDREQLKGLHPAGYLVTHSN